ncbi:MAG TPA: hypothetical protein PLI27_04465 [Ignavibacteriales bacterium]|nr:hypothetical protein [Ignavibacteriales bacterium]HOL80526.1 hypothetical protein [Ignavibacteriales bacterium]HOM64215.1 hypothetical protein [Ignavibacteriales bacterium]HPD67312.1 hypothetical protein [Ignavibacteriales bacterium]HPP33138.1 hypothetical protein [Ignavibacteriales bacterium]
MKEILETLNIKKNFIDFNRIIDVKVKKKYNIIVTIPVFNEFDFIEKFVRNFNKQDDKYFDKLLVIFNVNNTKTVEDTIRNNNERTYKLLNSYKFTFDTLIIDNFSNGNELDDKNGGVGIARKIAMDNALFHFDYSNKSRNVLICLDADCFVDNYYITKIFEFYQNSDVNAAYVNYKHQLEYNIDEIISYELYLRYYVLSLKYANSYYAFHTIGSTMTCTPEAYVKIEGMNKRKAAEDFYFMQKLAKNYKIYHIKDTTIYPSDRISHRVPFGTGKAIHNYYEGLSKKYFVYDFKIFEILKEFLQTFNDIITDADDFTKKFNEIHPLIVEFLEENDFRGSWNNILKYSKYDNQIQEQKRIWFDGFRTLKFVHFFENKLYKKSDTFINYEKLFNNLKISNDFIPFRKNADIENKIKFLKKVIDTENKLL